PVEEFRAADLISPLNEGAILLGDAHERLYHATDSSLVTTPVCDKVRALVYLDSADTTIRHGSHTRRGIRSVPRGVSCPWQTGHVVKGFQSSRSCSSNHQ